MKTIFKTILVLIALNISSCDNNDDTTASTSNDGFAFNNTFYETVNAYYEIDTDDDNPTIGNDGFPDNYTFFLTDGRMFDNDTQVNTSDGEYLFSMNTTRLAFLHIRVEDNPSLANSAPTPGNTYNVVNSDSVIIHDAQINSLTTPYFNNGIEFGEADENIGTYHTPGVAACTLTVNAMNIDTTNLANSTIDIDYTFMDQNGALITGHYEGTLGIILD